MFYVYIYLDPLFKADVSYGALHFDHIPIYVGKGKNKRMTDHLKFTNNPIFRNKIAWWKAHNIAPIIVKLRDNLTESEAWMLEKDYIAAIGRKDQGKGTLLNLTDGGDGPSGRTAWNKGKARKTPLTDAQKALISAANKGKIVSSETKQKISATLKGRPKSEETKAKLRQKNLGKSNHPNKGKTGVWSPEQLAQAAEKRKQYWTEAKRADHGRKFSGRKLSDEHKQKILESRKNSGYNHSSETKARMSIARKEYWANKRRESGNPTDD